LLVADAASDTGSLTAEAAHKAGGLKKSVDLLDFFLDLPGG
jgi:hypothetical protein